MWRDTADLWPGQDWRAVIRRAIADGALVFLACFSSRSVARSSGYQNAELALAAEQARLRRTGDSWLVPVRFDQCELPDLDLGGGRTLGSIQRADLFGGQASLAAERLVEAIQRILDAALRPGILPGQGIAGDRQVAVGDIPRQPAAYQDRPDLARLLAARIAGELPVVLVVTGLRGTGKTQTAAALARQRLAQGWSVVAWMDASSQGSLLAGYGELAVALGLAEDSPDPETAAARVRRWLEDGGGRWCLVVLDNALSAGVVRPFLPTSGLAQVVVTSSRASLAALGVPVPVDVFSEEEAVAFLAERTGLEVEAGALDVARELGCLPLALAQAGAVIAGLRLNYAAYLSRLAGVAVARYLPQAEEDPYPRGTAEAIMLALDAALADDASGLGGRVLGMLALLSEAGLPRGLLADPAQAGAAVADGILGHLAGWSVVSFSVDGARVIAHRLVLRVLRERATAAITLAQARRMPW